MPGIIIGAITTHIAIMLSLKSTLSYTRSIVGSTNSVRATCTQLSYQYLADLVIKKRIGGAQTFALPHFVIIWASNGILFVAGR